MEAIILAGGLGTRLRPAVPNLPKPMAPVNGRPFLEHQIDYWIRQGVRRFVLSVGYMHEAIEGYFGASYRGAEIAYAVERSPLGTGGGLLLAMDDLQGPTGARRGVLGQVQMSWRLLGETDVTASYANWSLQSEPLRDDSRSLFHLSLRSRQTTRTPPGPRLIRASSSRTFRRCPTPVR